MPPFGRGPSLETIRHVLEQEPRPPSTLNRSVESDLETICLKCLEKEPSRRYASAAALAEDLERWVRYEPIQARPCTTIARVLRWTRRKPAVAALVVAVNLLLVLGLAGVLWQWQRAEGHRSALETQSEEMRLQLYAAFVRVAHSVLADGDLAHARQLLATNVPAPGQTDLRGFEWRYLWQQTLGEETASLPTGNPFLWYITASQDGRLVAAGNLIWDAQTSALLRTLPTGTTALGFVPGIEGLLVQTADGLEIITIAGSPMEPVLPGVTANAVVFSRSGRWLAVGSEDGLRVYDTEKREVVAFKTDFGFGLLATKGLAFSPDESLLVTAAKSPLFNRSELLFWELPDLDPLSSPGKAAADVTTILFSADGRQFYTGHMDGSIHTWDAATRTELVERRRTSHSLGWISQLGLLADGSRLVSVGADRCVRVWAPDTADSLITLRGHTDEIWGMALAADRDVLHTVSRDGTVKRWSLPSLVDARASESQLTSQPAGYPVGLSADGKWLVLLREQSLQFHSTDAASLSEDVSRRWTAPSLANLRLGIGSKTDMVAISQDLRWLAVARTNQPVDLWDLERKSRKALLTTCGSDGVVVFSGDNRLLVTVGADSLVHVWDLEGVREVGTVALQGFYDGRWPCLFAYATNVLAIVGGNRALLWDAASGRVTRSFEIEAGGTTGFALSPDAGMLATGNTDNLIRLYDCNAGRLLEPPLAGHLSSSDTLIFSRDGRTVFTGGDRRVKLWHVATHREFFSWEHSNLIHFMELSARGDLLVTADTTGRLRIWRSPVLAGEDSSSIAGNRSGEQRP